MLLNAYAKQKKRNKQIFLPDKGICVPRKAAKAARARQVTCSSSRGASQGPANRFPTRGVVQTTRMKPVSPCCAVSATMTGQFSPVFRQAQQFTCRKLKGSGPIALAVF